MALQQQSVSRLHPKQLVFEYSAQILAAYYLCPPKHDNLRKQ